MFYIIRFFKPNGFDHINRNAPVLVRSPKLTRFELAQYWGGRPPGNSVVLNPFVFVEVITSTCVVFFHFFSTQLLCRILQICVIFMSLIFDLIFFETLFF